ncbi:hypothetical protein LCGC14_1638820 [marine sediment metagenome]|uniref:Uncharacterized protein n=1 Tax=marine sediment metagenome TaxID=412755 RepID=A0A0F9FT88_9ZZZZ
MAQLTWHDLEILDGTLQELVLRCRKIEGKSESEIVRNYLAEMNVNMAEVRSFLECPIAVVIVDESPP